MDHTKIVFPNELEDFANRRDAESVIPELINLLVNLSAPDLTLCRIPYGDEVGLPGRDGIVHTETGFRQFVPPQISLWEIGRGEDAQGKATADYKKRTDAVPGDERAKSTFVFATPRSRDWSETEQSEWLRRRQGDGWKSIKILDGVQLSDWLREFPAVGKWLLKKIGLVRGTTGLRTPAEHWEVLTHSLGKDDPPLPPKLFLVGRDAARQSLDRLFRREIQQLVLATESELDADDFVAAYLQSLDEQTRRAHGSRCIFISEADAWETFSSLRVPHVLVASPRLDLAEANEQLHMAARARGHGIIIPVTGAWAHGADKLIPILSPSRAVLETTLIENGFARERASELASAGAQSLAALKRHLRGLGEMPPYANSENARLLAQAMLAGKWKGSSPADQEALESLLGKPYGEWIDAARAETLRADTPLIQRNESWKMILRGEAWVALGPRITDDDLGRFERLAISVLAEQDPMFELSKEERHAAAIHGKVLKRSKALREGIVETLALLGAKSAAISSASLGRAEGTAKRVVHQLLSEADWLTWASLNRELPLLAEAAPDVFLDCVESALANPESSPFNAVFAQEGGGFGGWNYMTGILWALETLAWHPDYLGRATVLLGDLASIDPGGNWANRPKNSLVDIYLPWHAQTTAELPQRRAALEALIREHLDVGWTVLLGLLPSSHGATSGTRKPVWRTFIPRNWKESTTHNQYWDQVQMYAEICTRIAANSLPKLEQLVDRLGDLPEPAHSRVLDHLASDSVVSLPENARISIWEALQDLATKHRKFADAQWAMSAETITKIDQVAIRLAPKSFDLANRRLFTERDHDLYDDKGNYDEQAKRLDVKRQEILKEIWTSRGPKGVLEFSIGVESPRKAGNALGGVEDLDIDSFLLPAYLGDPDTKVKQFVASFVWRRFFEGKWRWAEHQIGPAWDQGQILAFLLLIPSEPETWSRVTGLLGPHSSEYWKQVNLNPWWLDEKDLPEAAEKLASNGQPAAAIDCLYLLSHKKVRIPMSLATKVLLGTLASEAQQKRMEQHHASEVIKWLQENESSDSEDLFRIEWNFLPLLNRIHGGGPTILERRLATSPRFFCEVVALVFRSDKEDKEVKREPSEQEKNIAQNAYRLLHGWRILPGQSMDGQFDGNAFHGWLEEVKKITRESGHFKIAMDQLGQALAYSPADPDGLWIHKSIAEALNSKETPEMRRALTSGLFNKRGVFMHTHGEEEKRIAADYREKANALSDAGFLRVGDAIRSLAEGYERDAERESKRDIFDE